MRALICVFSGTGNTLAAAEMVAAELEALGHEAMVVRMTYPAEAYPDLNDFDLIGVGYPIHAFNAPQICERYLKKLVPLTSGKKPLFIFKTSGEPFHANSASSRRIIRILRKKGLDPLFETHMLMPYNIMFRYKDALVKQMYAHTGRMARLVARRAVLGERDKLRVSPLTVALAAALRLQWLGALINGPLISADREKCAACGLCVKNCPAGNIEIRDGSARFGNKCTMCMGCAMLCPADAVRPGFLNPWRVNGRYDFEKIKNDPHIPETYVNENTRGYFKLFRSYYERTEKRLRERGL